MYYIGPIHNYSDMGIINLDIFKSILKLGRIFEEGVRHIMASRPTHKKTKLNKKIILNTNDRVYSNKLVIGRV